MKKQSKNKSSPIIMNHKTPGFPHCINYYLSNDKTRTSVKFGLKNHYGLV